MHLLKKLIPFIFVLSVVPWISQWSSQEDIGWVISWMYDNGLTSYVSQDQFRPDKTIRRDEASKFVTKFSQAILLQEQQENSDCYIFNDIPKKSNLKDYIIQACELWHMKWSNNKFNPSWNLSNAQAITIIIRMYEWMLDEPKSDRSKNYYQRAEELALLDGLSLSDKKKAITRWEFAILLYRLWTQLNEAQVREDSESLYESDTIWDTLWDSLQQWATEMFEYFVEMMWFHINLHTWLTTTFINQASMCISWSSVMTQTDFDMLSININFKQYTKINGWNSWKCEVYERIDGVDIKMLGWQIQQALSSGSSIEEINQQFSIIRDAFADVLWKDGICLYDTWALVANLQNALSWTYLSSSFINSSQATCTWSMYQDN